MNCEIKEGNWCLVIKGTHKGKQGKAQDLNLSKTGHWTLTILQENGVRFKTLARNCEPREK